MIIRTGAPKDYPQIGALCEAQGWTSFKRPDYGDMLRASILLVAEEDERIVGFARALADGYVTLFLCEIIVASTFRRRGIGRRLIESLHTMYPSCRIDLISEADEFYAACGFRKIGTGFRKSYL